MANIVPDKTIKDYDVVGIDFGTSTIYAYTYNEDTKSYGLIEFRERKDKGIDSMIYFSSSEEYEIGKNAKEKYLKGDKESKYVFLDCKRFLGNEFTEEQYEELKKQYPFGENIIYNQKEKKIYFSVYDKIYSAQDICSKMIEKITQKIQNIHNTKPIRYVISNPSSFSISQRQELEHAIKDTVSKYNFLRLVEEPVAAGLTEIKEKGKYIIFDWGAGTLDIAVIEYKNEDGKKEITILENSEGIVNLGGRDYDEIFYKQQIKKIEEEFNGEIKKVKIGTFKTLLEEKKIELNMDGVKNVLIPNSELKKMFDFEDEDDFDEDEDYEITLDDFNECLTLNNTTTINENGLLTECTDSENEIEKMVHEKDIDKAIHCLLKVYNDHSNANKIIMVGGTSQLKLLKEKLREIDEIKDKIIFSKTPLFSVANGAAVSAVMEKNKEDIVKEFVSKTYSRLTSWGPNSLIEKGKKRGDIEILKAKIPKDKEIKFNIVLGDSIDARLCGHYYIDFKEIKGANEGMSIEIKVYVNKNGMIEAFTEIGNEKIYFKGIRRNINNDSEYSSYVNRQKCINHIEGCWELLNSYKRRHDTLSNDLKKALRLISTYEANKNSYSVDDLIKLCNELDGLTNELYE